MTLQPANRSSARSPFRLAKRIAQHGPPTLAPAAVSAPRIAAVVVSLCLAAAKIAAAQPDASDFQSVSAAATMAQQQHDIPRAIALYRQAVQLNPKWTDGWWYLGVLQYGINDYAPARDALSHFIELAPEAGPAFAIRGLCEFETADYDQSLSDIERALSQGAANQARNTGILRYHEVLLLSHAGRFEEALAASAEFSKGEAAPEIVQAVGMAGLRVSLLPQQVPDAGRDLYLAAGSAALAYLSGDAPRARQAFEALFQRFPDTPNAHYLYGYLLFGKDPDGAIAEFKKELAIAPSNATAEAMLGWADMIEENYPEARIHGAKAVALAPQITAGQLVLGRALVETGDLKGGVEHLQQALSAEPGNLEVHLALVRAYSKSGQREQAQRERQQCLLITRESEPHAAQP
jgi:tetratricopeptide (TPR) repeat protein